MKKNRGVKGVIHRIVIFGILWAAIAFFTLSHAGTGPETARDLPAQALVAHESQTPPRSNFMWIVGELALGIITMVVLLIIYSWHLRKVVEKKTRELKEFNIRLEDKVKARTLALKQSKEEYKSMYAHAEAERKRAKVALKSEREAIQQNLNFIDMISHEYRTPLSVLSSSVEIIDKKCGMIEYHDLDDQLAKMKISIKRLVDIFDSFLVKDQIDNHSPQLRIESLNLSQVIEAAAALTKSVHMAHEIRSDLDDTLFIPGDEKLLVTVFSNILDNACKYCDPKAPIQIKMHGKTDHVQIIIIDSGMGIDEDEIHMVFKKYFRSQRTGVKQGAGIGLFMVQKILELHKGNISLTSRRNKGTRVEVSLPRG